RVSRPVSTSCSRTTPTATAATSRRPAGGFTSRRNGAGIAPRRLGSCACCASKNWRRRMMARPDPKRHDPAVPDAGVRLQAETTFDRNVVVVAGAGTGKTTLLVNRLVYLLMKEPAPVPITQIVALTFTN